MKSICTSLGITLIFDPSLAGRSRTDERDKQVNEIFEELDKLIDIYLPKLGTCSQTSFYVLNKVFNLDADDFVRSLASMPGVASRGETCGAVTGCLLAIGLVFEEDIFDDERKRLSNEPSFSFCAQFENSYGSTRCRDVIEEVSGKKYPINKPEDYMPLAAEGVFQHCPGVIKEAVHMAAELILQKPLNS